MLKNKFIETNKIISLAHIGTGGQKGWVYSSDGIAPTLPATQYKDPTKIIIKGKNITEQDRCIR